MLFTLSQDKICIQTGVKKMKRICALCCNICLCVFCSQMLSVAANDCCHEVLFLVLYVGFPSRLLLLVFPEGFSVFSSITSNKKDLPEGQILLPAGFYK